MGREATVIDHPEPIAAELARLVGARPPPRGFSQESVGGAARLAAVRFLQVPTRNMDLGVTVEVTIVLVEDTEGEPLSVSQKPGRLLVSFSGALFGGSDAEGDAEGTALAAHALAWRWSGWHGGKIVGSGVPNLTILSL